MALERDASGSLLGGVAHGLLPGGTMPRFDGVLLVGALAGVLLTYRAPTVAPSASVVPSAGDNANGILRADRFLALYPAAPQAARVRELRAAAAK